MKKRLLAAALCALLLLSGCSAAADDAPDAAQSGEEQIVLRFFHYQGEAEEAYNRVIAAYEAAHPNVTIKSEYLNSESYNSTLDARIAVQDCPDIIGVHPGYAQVLPLAEAGYLADLTGQPCLDGVRESDVDTARLDGRVYGAPIDLTYICTFYNTEIFERLGLEPPHTWDAFLAVCETLKENGITPLSLCYKDTWIQSLIPYALSVTTIYRENPDFDRQMAEGLRHFNGPEWQKTMQMLKTLIDSGYVTENYLQTTYDQQLRAFANGGAAMMVMGSWAVSMIRSMAPSCRLGLFILPASEDGDNWIPSSIGGMLAVSEQSRYKDTAIDFLNFFLTNDEVYRQFLQDTGNMPVKTGFDAGCDPALEALNGEITESYPFLDVGWPSGVQAVFIKTMEEISTGADMTQALAHLDQVWTEFYREG